MRIWSGPEMRFLSGSSTRYLPNLSFISRDWAMRQRNWFALACAITWDPFEPKSNLEWNDKLSSPQWGLCTQRNLGRNFSLTSRTIQEVWHNGLSMPNQKPNPLRSDSFFVFLLFSFFFFFLLSSSFFHFSFTLFFSFGSKKGRQRKETMFPIFPVRFCSLYAGKSLLTGFDRKSGWDRFSVMKSFVLMEQWTMLKLT